MLAPDCGMKYLTRQAAFGKLKALAEGAALVRKELAATPFVLKSRCCSGCFGSTCCCTGFAPSRFSAWLCG